MVISVLSVAINGHSRTEMTWEFYSNVSSALADSCVPLPTRQTTTYDLFLSHHVQCQITNWTLGQSVSSCGDFSDECTARICVWQGFLDLTAGCLGICGPLGGVRRPQTLLCLCAGVCYVSSLGKTKTERIYWDGMGSKSSRDTHAKKQFNVVVAENL